MGSIHTKIAADADVTVYRRVDEHVVEVSDVADHELTYIIVDHGTKKTACGPTQEQAWQNLRRVRTAAPAQTD
jgi:hypothetical protein